MGMKSTTTKIATHRSVTEKKTVEEGKMPHYYPQNGWSCFVLNSLALQYVFYTCS